METAQPSRPTRCDVPRSLRLETRPRSPHARVHDENYLVDGVRKVWRQLCRQRGTGDRDQLVSVMKDLGLHGVRRGKAKRTTAPADHAPRSAAPGPPLLTAPASDSCPCAAS
jgi:hypothetical protein